MTFSDYDAVVEPFWEHVRRQPEATALIFIGDDDSETAVTAAQFHELAAAYAHQLHAAGVVADQIVFIALPHSLDLLAAFWGALYVGATPSIFPYLIPRPDIDLFYEQLRQLVAETDAGAVFVSADQADGLSVALADHRCCVLDDQALTVAEETAVFTPQAREFLSLEKAAAGGEQIAYLQYTSGTSGMQKGVQLSHRAVLNFVEQFTRALAITAKDVVVNWMPLYHDFGLFAGLVMPLASGIPVVMMSPFKWTRRPIRLFQAIQRHRGTLCWITNSAYTHAARSVRRPAESGLDLSSLRVFLNGAEPIYLHNQQAFLDHFAPAGFREAVLATGYGMAENTLTVSVSPLGRPPRVDWVAVERLQEEGRARPAAPHAAGSQPVVSCGAPVWGAEVAITDENGRHLAEREVGEVTIRTNCLFSGYHGRPDLTAAVFKDGWYYTGDLGYLAEGELFICGRKKDMIIIGGRNIYPEDLEAVANKIPGIYPDRSVAFGVVDERLGTERVVMICDLQQRKVDEAARLDIERALRSQIYQELDVSLSELHLMPRGWVVKTQNGKLTRIANRQKYESEMSAG